MKNKIQLPYSTTKTKYLIQMLQTFQPTSDIILFVNNNVKELLLELDYITQETSFDFFDCLCAYIKKNLNEPWEYSFFDYFYARKLKKFYKNIVIRLHHYSSTAEKFGIPLVFYWYTVHYKTYDAICIYKEKEEIHAATAEFLLLSEYTFAKENEESLNRKSSECIRLIVAFEWDQEKYDPLDTEYLDGKCGLLTIYKKKTLQDIENYKKNFQKKKPEMPSDYSHMGGYYYYREIGYNQELLEEYQKKNPEEEIANIKKKIKKIKNS
jgi:hypothetical protein